MRPLGLAVAPLPMIFLAYIIGQHHCPPAAFRIALVAALCMAAAFWGILIRERLGR